MAECSEMSAGGTYPKFYAGLTDRILNHWATQKTLPRRILFHNVYGNFTLSGVLAMINVGSFFFFVVVFRFPSISFFLIFLERFYDKCLNDKKASLPFLLHRVAIL